MKYGLWCPKGCDRSLIGYSDSNFSSCKIDRKIIIDTCHLFGIYTTGLLHIKKQVSVTLSNVEEEYVDVESYCVQIIWLKQQLKTSTYSNQM